MGEADTDTDTDMDRVLRTNFQAVLVAILAEALDRAGEAAKADR